MSRYEEKIYQVGKSKPDIAAMKNQLTRLKHDLEQFTARKPDGAVIGTLQERIRTLQAEIAEAEANRDREKRSAAPPDPTGPAGPEPSGKSSTASYTGTGVRLTSGRFPPRHRAGR